MSRSRNTKVFDLTVKANQIVEIMDGMVKAAQESVRPAAQAAAQVIYDEARRLAPRSERAHFFYGTASKNAPPGQKKKFAYGPFQPGNLQRAIYQVYSEDNSGPGRATYHVSWNFEKAPYAYMVENGTVRATARPFMRPAMLKIPEAQAALEARFIREMKKRGAL